VIVLSLVYQLLTYAGTGSNSLLCNRATLAITVRNRILAEHELVRSIASDLAVMNHSVAFGSSSLFVIV